MIPAMAAMESATSVQASSTDVITGTYQRRPPRSRTSQVSSSGTDVPMWSGEESSTLVPGPSCGASMIPAATATRTSA